MADLKISQLTDGGASQAADEYVVARSGSNFRIDGASVAAAATSVGTLTSLTVSGDLTVDTSTLKVDAANNRVGVGTTSPSVALDVVNSALGIVRVRGGGGTNEGGAFFISNSAGSSTLAAFGDYARIGGGATDASVSIYTNASIPLRFDVGGTERMRLDASGNLGLGVTPSAWALSGLSAMQIKNASFFGYANNAYMSANEFIDAASSPKYIATAAATRYQQGSGAHTWYTAASGTAGNTISFTQAMTLDASGNLGVGVTSPTTPIDVKSGSVDGVAVRIRENASGNALIQITDDPVTTARLALSWTNSTTSANFSTTGLLSFSTNGSERARITSGGYFKASNDGTYTGSTASYHEMRSDANNNPICYFKHTTSSNPYGPVVEFSQAPDNNTNYFFKCSDGNGVTDRLIIYSDGDVLNHDGTYGTLPSERRFKQDITDANTQWDDIKNIRLRRYRMISDVEAKGEDAPYQLGVIIDELEQVSPGLVVESPVFEKREVEDEDGNVTTEQVQVDTVKGWKTSIVHLKALKALQEAMARIEALEARLEALEA